MATSAVGGDPANAMCGAKAIELLHVASLVHDDIIDGAVERRGMPALHVQLGVERALVIGDYLLLRAMTVLTQDTSCDSGTTVRVLGTLGAYAEQCCRGQVRELEPSAAGDREREYAAVAGWKTGAPFAAAASVGAILGGGLDPEIEALGEYGTRLGIAFQIEDDLRDLGDDARVGAETPKGLASLPRHELAIETVRATQASLVALALDALDGLPKSGALDDLYLLPSRLLGCEASPVTRNARHDILTRKSRG